MEVSCGLCQRRIGWSGLAEHVLELHIPSTQLPLWKCPDCSFDSPDINNVVKHCFASRHDVGRIHGSSVHGMLELLRRVQDEAELEIPLTNGNPASLTAPTFTADIKAGPAFNLDDLTRPSSDEGAGSSSNGAMPGPPALKRGPPSLSEDLESGLGRFKSPRLTPADQGGFLEPATHLTDYMETRAESKSGNAQDERSMKAYAWLLCREMYPEALLAGFDCVPNSLHFGKYQQSRFAEETVERQPRAVQQILESTMRKFHFGPGSGLSEEARHNRIRTLLDHLKTNRYNIRRKLNCPCGNCKKPQPQDSFLFDSLSARDLLHVSSS